MASKLSALLPILVTLLALGVATPATAQDVLYCVDQVEDIDRMDEALVALEASIPGFAVTRVDDLTAEGCDATLAAGTWDLVIAFAQNDNYPLTGVLAHVAAGGRTILGDWTLSSAIASAFGATYSGSENDTNLTVGPVLGTGLTSSSITLANSVWGTFSSPLTPTTGTSLATLGTGSGIVLNAGGTAILNGFLNDTGGPDLAVLFRNEVLLLAFDRDEDGTPFPADCDDTDASIHPGASDDDCDGVDQNCSGEADEGFVSTATACGVGACGAVGALVCIDGATTDSCEVAAPPAADDVTCDGIDDDCDGTVDEDCTPDAGIFDTDAGMPDAGTPDTDASIGADAGVNPTPTDADGCSCSAPGATTRGPGGALALLGLLGLVIARRRRS